MNKLWGDLAVYMVVCLNCYEDIGFNYENQYGPALGRFDFVYGSLCELL